MKEEEKKTTEEVQKVEETKPAEEAPKVEKTKVSSQENTTEKKSNVRTVLLILLFIFLFAYIMFMPQVNEFINNVRKDTGLSPIERRAKEIEKELNEKENDSNEASKQEKLSKLVCTSGTLALESYDKTVVETFEYNSKKQVITSAVKTTYTFVTVNDNYENLKVQCNENGLKFIDKEGYETACSYNDNEVVTEEKFNLSKFKKFQDGANTIEANAKYKEELNSVKTRLESLGYTCE